MRIGIECSREAIAINCQLSEKPMTVTLFLEKQSAPNTIRCRLLGSCLIIALEDEFFFQRRDQVLHGCVNPNSCFAAQGTNHSVLL